MLWAGLQSELSVKDGNTGRPIHLAGFWKVNLSLCPSVGSFFLSHLADLGRTQPPRQKEGSLPDPLGRTEAFQRARCWAPSWWFMERRPEWEPMRGMFNVKGLEKKVRAVSEMLTQLKTQSKATESSFCPCSCVWVDVNAFLSGAGLGGIRTPHPEFA